MPLPPAVLDPSLDPLFWDNLRVTSSSAWHGHVPFAHWLVSTIHPREIVELGSHTGVSYAALCQAVQRSGIAARCSAIDSWAGDDHAGAYTEDVYTELKAFHDPLFGRFSRLLRKSFDAALEDFADGSIDLLHIDGFHTYEAVSHDFHTWRPKLSDRAVVLFHDTNVHERDFGVWRFWAEISAIGVASMEFLHSFGLGVLLVGPNADPVLSAMCDAPVERVRSLFATLGQGQVLNAERTQRPAVAPESAAPSTPPPLDPTLDPGMIHIAERFVAPPRMNGLRLPRDALLRGTDGCAVWVISADGHAWRQGVIGEVPDTDAATLVFAPFENTENKHFHLFVTDPGPDGTGLPPRLAEHLGNRRAPIALDTPSMSPDLIPSGARPTELFLLKDSIAVRHA